MPMPILLHKSIENRNIQIKNIDYYNSARTDGDPSIEDSDYPSPCAYPGSYPPPTSPPLPLRVDQMPPKSVTIFSLDTLDDDDDDDLPPLVDAPIRAEAEAEIGGDEDDEDAPPPLVDIPPESDPNANASVPHGAGVGVQYTFSTITPSTIAFGADANADIREPEERVLASALGASPTFAPSPTARSTAGMVLTTPPDYSTTTTGPQYLPGLPHPHPPQFATQYTLSHTLGRSEFLAHPLSSHIQAQSPGGSFEDHAGSGSVGGRMIAAGGGSFGGGGGGAFTGGGTAFGGRTTEPPSPSNADIGSPSPAPSPSYAGDSTTTATTSHSQLSAQSYTQRSGDSGHSEVTQGQGYGQDGPREIEFSLRLENADKQREPTSGPQRTGHGQSQSHGHDQGQTFVFATPNVGAGTGKKQGRPPSYIPRPPNAFILFRASFVRSQRFGGGSSAAFAGVGGKGSGVPGITTGGVSALGPGSVITIEESHDTRPPSPSSRRGSIAGLSLPAGPTPSTSLSKMAGQIWRAMPAHERAVWEARARTAQAEHRAKYPDWRFRPENASGVEAWSTDPGGDGGGGGGIYRGGAVLKEGRGVVREGGGGRGEGSALWSGGTGGGDTWEGMVAVGKYKAGASAPDIGAVRDSSRKGKDRDVQQGVHSEKEDEGGGGVGRGEKTKTGVGTSPVSHPSPGFHGEVGTGTSPGASSSTHTSGSRAGVRTRAQNRARAGTRVAAKATFRARAIPKARGNGGRTRADTVTSTNMGTVANELGRSKETMNEQSHVQPLGLPGWAVRGLESPEASPVASAKVDARATNAGAKRNEDEAEGTNAGHSLGSEQNEEPLPAPATDSRSGVAMPSASPNTLSEQNAETIGQHESMPGRGDSVATAEKNEQVRVHEDSYYEEQSQPRKGSTAGLDDARFAIRLTDIARRSASVAPSAPSTSVHQETAPSTAQIHAPIPSVSAIVPRTLSADDQNRLAASRAGSCTQSIGQLSPQARASSVQGGAVHGEAEGEGQDFAQGFPNLAHQGQGEGHEQVSQHPETLAHTRSISQPYQQVQSFSRVQEQVFLPLQTQNQAFPKQHAQGLTTATSIQGAPTGGFRSSRRNTVSVPGGTAIPVTGVSALFRFPAGQYQRRIIATAPAIAPDGGPGGGAGVSLFGYGQMYTQERAEEHASPPPLSPAVSSPLSSSSPTYGHGSPPMPFMFSPSTSVHAQLSPPHYAQHGNGHPYAHARAHSHSFQQLAQRHRRIQTQDVISPMMLPAQGQAQAQHTQPQEQVLPEQGGFVSPSHYGQGATAVGIGPEYGQDFASSGASIPMDMDVDLSVGVASHAMSSMAGSVSAPHQQEFPAGGMAQNYISTYSSLTEWAGGTTPYSGTSASSSVTRMHTPSLAGDGSGLRTNMTTGSANAQAFSSPSYERAFPHFDGNGSAGDDTGGTAAHWYGYSDTDNVPYPSHSGSGIGESSGISYALGPNIVLTPRLASDAFQQFRQHQQIHQFHPQPQSEPQAQAHRELIQYERGASQASEFHLSEVVPEYTHREQHFVFPGMQSNHSQHVAMSGDMAGEGAHVVQRTPVHAEMGSPHQRSKEKRK